MTKEFWDAVCVEPDEDLEETSGVTTLLIDADIIAFQSASTADGRKYTIAGRNFKYMKDALSYIGKKGLDRSDLVLSYSPEPEINSLHNVETSIRSLRKVFPGAKCEFFISGDLNFRDALVEDYKKNREGKRRPKHLSVCKQHILNKFKGILTEGMEADDLIGIRAEQLRKAGKDYVICTLDKDIDMIPGKHYNWRKSLHYEVNEYDAMMNFFCQCLTGDKTDNIYGLDGIGPVKAKAILEAVEDKTPANLWLAVVEAWESHKGHKELNSEEVLEKLLVSAKLLWILRQPFMMFKPPTAEGEAIDIQTESKVNSSKVKED
ncbi:MAG: hypothetical protein KAS32_02500 [Candidatus Peribacteraceae bacterium]|nr:hypothetical protein [Candidatus Peribacteraceae bacterium]